MIVRCNRLRTGRAFRASYPGPPHANWWPTCSGGRRPTQKSAAAKRSARRWCPGFTDENGKVLFTYGHPLFWAPYMIIGDGGW